MACGSETSSPAVTPSVADFTQQLAAVACDWQLRCCSPLELEAAPSGQYTTQEQCLPYARLALDKALVSVRADVASGRITLDPAAAKACLEAARARLCNPSTVSFFRPRFEDFIAGCRSAFTGQISEGRLCSLSAECQPGLRCVGGSSVDAGIGTPEGPAPSGACLAYQKRGEVCQSDDDCLPEDHCGPLDHRCAARSGAGGPCGDIVDSFGNVVVPSVAACAAGLSCDILNHVCLNPSRDGDTCQQFTTNACDPDPKLALSCVGAGFNGAGVCKTAGKSGDACGASGLPICAGGLACNAAPGQIGTCGAPPKAGQPCTGLLECASPALCDSATGLCRLAGPQAVGERCTTADDCASLFCARTENGDGGTPPSACAPPQLMRITCSGAGVNVASSTPMPTTSDGGVSFDERFEVEPVVDAFNLPVGAQDAGGLDGFVGDR